MHEHIPAKPLPAPARSLEVAPAMAALLVLVALAVFAGPVAAYLDGTTAQLFDRAGYVGTVIGPVETAP